MLHAGRRDGSRRPASIRVRPAEALLASLRAAWREVCGEYGGRLRASRDAGAGADRRRRRRRPAALLGVTIEPADPEAAARHAVRLQFRCRRWRWVYLDWLIAQAETFRDGAFSPADLFVRTEGGGWRFAGREDSLVKIKGRWVNLVELEERMAAGAAGLLEAGTVCIPDADGVDCVALFYVAREGQAEAVAQVLRERAAALPPYQRPSVLQPVPVLPRTPTGKLLRRRLAELLPPPGAQSSECRPGSEWNESACDPAGREHRTRGFPCSRISGLRPW